LQEIATNFFAKYFVKTLFATNFVGNTYKFYNFVGNNYPRRNYLPIKFLEKMAEKKSFLTIFFNKFPRKISYNMKFFSSFIIRKPSQKVRAIK